MEISRTIPSLLVFCSECQAIIYEDYTDVPGGYRAAREHVKNTGHTVFVEEHVCTEIRPTTGAADAATLSPTPKRGKNTRRG